MSTHHRLELPATPSDLEHHVAAVRALLPAWASSHGPTIAVGEALANAIVHGALGLGPRPSDAALLDRFLRDVERAGASGAGCVSVDVLEQDDALLVVVRDPGSGFDVASTQPTPGHGLWLIRQLTDESAWNESGNEVTLRWNHKR